MYDLVYDILCTVHALNMIVVVKHLANNVTITQEMLGRTLGVVDVILFSKWLVQIECEVLSPSADRPIFLFTVWILAVHSCVLRFCIAILWTFMNCLK